MSGERTDIAETIHPAQTPMSQTATPAPDRAAAVRDADDGETRGNAGSAASAPTSVGEMAGNKEGDAPPQGSEARPDAVSRTAEAAPVLYHAVGLTNVGLVREHNEDNLLLVDLALPQSLAPGDICPGHVPPQGLVLAVCDGMGGAAAGEVASQMAVDTIHTLMREGEVPKDRDSFAQRLVRAIRTAGFEIHEAARSDRARRGMGTTATVAALIDAVLFVGQVGDSRAYVWRDAELTQITKDQSLVNQLIEAGQLTEAEAEAFEHSNIILQALGTTEDVNVDLTFLELRRGDTLLLCSDGLTGMIGADAIHDVLQHCDDLHQAGTELIRLANEGGGHDNITVILARFDGESLRPVDADARVAYQQYPLPLDAETGHDATRPVALATRRSRPTRDAMPIVTLPGTSAVAGPPRSHGVAWRHTALALLAAAAAGALLVYGVGPARLWSWLFWRSNTDHNPHPQAALPTPAVVDGRVHVLSDVRGQLFVDGEYHGRLDGRTDVYLELPAGAYLFEARSEDSVVAAQLVTVPAAGQVDSQLLLPRLSSADAAPPEDTEPEASEPTPQSAGAPKAPPPPTPRKPANGGTRSQTPAPLGTRPAPTKPSGAGQKPPRQAPSAPDKKQTQSASAAKTPRSPAAKPDAPKP